MQITTSHRFSTPRLAGFSFLLLLWILFAVWQRTEYVHQSRLIRDSLAAQAEALSSAISSGVQSHRWFGPFVQQQLPESLEVLARSKHVIAIAVVVNGEADDAYFAGDDGKIDFSLPVGEHASDDRLQVVTQFSMNNNPPMMQARFSESADSEQLDFHAIVVLDRTHMVAQLNREAGNRILVFALGSLLLLTAGAMWQFTVRLARSEGTTRLLQAETRHLRELEQAAAGLAHETRNPLGLIRGWTQRLVETGLPTSDQQEQAEAVLEECDRVTSRINQFLAFARPADLRLEPVEVAALVDELRMLLQPDLDARRLTFETRRLDRPHAISADRDQLRQVLFNLLQNAIAFAPEESKVTIELCDSRDGSFRLQIADEGPGAEKEIVDSLFEPYVTRRTGGTGLGLSIVHRIAVAHGWNVGYKSGPDGGALFWIDGIRLPGH